jgi:hypothetical protein
LPLATITHQGKSWPINEFVNACLKGESQFPAAIAATIIRHVQAYDNHGTISGSSLHTECDYQALLERSLDYTKEITDLWPASFRGANVHGLLETCRDDPRFEGWAFEKRLFAALDTDGDIFPLFPAGTDKKRDWKSFEKICQDLREEGHIILSGALDAFDIVNGVGHDYKTKSKVGPYTQVSDSWHQQMVFYTFLARLHGYQVDAFKISAMDATGVVVLDVELPIEELWVQDYLIPRVRKLSKHQQFTMEEIRAVNEGALEPPEDFPEPVVNYLCDGENKAGKIYCPVRSQCIKWRKT